LETPTGSAGRAAHAEEEPGFTSWPCCRWRWASGRTPPSSPLSTRSSCTRSRSRNPRGWRKCLPATPKRSMPIPISSSPGTSLPNYEDYATRTRLSPAWPRHLSHTPDWGGQAERNIERLAGERELLRRAGRKALSRPHVCRRWRQETRRQPGSGIELQLVGPAIRFRRQADRPDITLNGTPYTGPGCRAAKFQRNRVARPPGRALDSHQHARLRAYRPAQESRESPGASVGSRSSAG